MSGFESLLSAGFNDTAKADLSLFNSIGVTNEPMLSGKINPRYKHGAEEAELRMIDAERQQREADEEDTLTRKVAEEMMPKEKLEQYNKEYQKKFDRNKAEYQGGKGQWQMSGKDMDAKSYIEGFDDVEDDG